MNVSEAIRMKRAVRNYTEEPIPQEAMRAILNAGRRAQSSKNTQPWQFIAMTEKPVLKAFSLCGQYAGHLAGAALGVAILTPNPDERFQIHFDVGQAAAYMQLQAWELGVGSCIASIYDMQQARTVLGFPAEWYVFFALSFGYPEEAGKLTAAPKKGGRQPLDALVHWERW